VDIDLIIKVVGEQTLTIRNLENQLAILRSQNEELQKRLDAKKEDKKEKTQ
jgi:hypothetical protein